MAYRGFAFQQKRGRQDCAAPAVPKRGYGVRAGVNKPAPIAWATPEFAARNGEAHDTIFDWATGETVGTVGDYRKQTS